MQNNRATKGSSQHSRSSVSSSVGSSTSSSEEDLSLRSSSNAIIGTMVRASQPSIRSDDRHRPAKSPATIERTRSSGSESTAEPVLSLFDDRGCATSKCNQFLDGLAKHIVGHLRKFSWLNKSMLMLRYYQIDDYTPKGSLVITPEKLTVFYSKYRLANEPLTGTYSVRAGNMKFTSITLSPQHGLSLTNWFS